MGPSSQGANRFFARTHFLACKGVAGGVGVKTGGSWVGGHDLCVYADGNRKQGTQMFTQVRALSMEVKPYFLLD